MARLRRIETGFVRGATRARGSGTQFAYFGKRHAMRTLLTAALLAFSGAVLLLAQDSTNRNGEEGRLLALESAWTTQSKAKTRSR